MKKLFGLDMDGVVADWLGAVKGLVKTSLTNPQLHYADDDWERIKRQHRLFRTLPLTPLANNFADTARRFRDELDYELVFLTAIPHNNDVPWCFADKLAWAQEHFPDIPVWFGPYTDDKQLRSAPGNILVDDRADNCRQWEARGGTAILVPVGSEEVGLNNLKTLLNHQLSLKAQPAVV